MPTLWIVLGLIAYWIIAGLVLLKIALFATEHRVCGCRVYKGPRFTTRLKVFLFLTNLPTVIIITVFGLPYWFITKVVASRWE